MARNKSTQIGEKRVKLYLWTSKYIENAMKSIEKILELLSGINKVEELQVL